MQYILGEGDKVGVSVGGEKDPGSETQVKGTPQGEDDQGEER